MKKFLSLAPLAAMALALIPFEGQASVADNWPVPASDGSRMGKRGATMPYTRYDCNTANDATLAGGATIKTSPDWAAANKASQASNQAYVEMPVGASVTWNMRTNGDGVTVRYTIKDKNLGGEGKAGGYATKEGKLEFYVNDVKAGEVDLTSYYMYQYFSSHSGGGSGSPSQSSGEAPCFCFDEKHVRLNRMMRPGDRLTVKCTSGDEVGVDFVETEVVPEPIDPADDANGRSVFNVTDYGAVADNPNKDNRDAFSKAVNAASRVGGIVFIPEGTWYMGHNGQGGHGIWSIAPKNVKIMGAGIWHTNIQFTGWEMFGGGISGGNPSNTGGSNTCDNVEVCHMYINSNLSDRKGENAVYKCFMDIWCEGSVIHDIWEQHFECGFWFGDYNSAQRRCSDGVRIVNCRIRDNYADGVNFCQGTSNAAVFNCSVRNNGDDGLACWNNTDGGVKDESGNIFAYNTIDFIWRAGGVAIYGGKNQKVYNNYICDMFMASGVHMNTTFPGPGFATTTATEPVLVENNYLVRAGAPWECWGRDYAAFDFEGTVKHLVFRNNHLYDCPGEAVRVYGAEGVIFDGLYVNGAGVSRQPVSYSASAHSIGAGNIQSNQGITWKDFQIVKGSVPQPTVGKDLNQYESWPFWNMAPTNWSWVEEGDIDWAETPPYPDAENIEPTPDPFQTLRNYDVKLTAIDWTSDRGLHSTMFDGDKVTFKVRIDNTSSTAIPADAKFAVTFSVDGKSNYSVTVKDGLPAHSFKIIEYTTGWIATKGKHTFVATVDPAGKMINETDRTNNSRQKAVNVNELAEDDDTEINIETHAGTDVGIVKVWFENESGENDEINIGDRLMPHAIVANYGSTSYNFGAGKGIVWKMDGGEYTQGIVWYDADFTLAPGEYREVTPSGGGSGSAKSNFNSDYTWTVTDGIHTLTAQADNAANYGDTEADNNALSVDVEYPVARPEYNPNPDKADRLDPFQENYWPYEDGGDEEVYGFDLNLLDGALVWSPDSKSISAGETISGFAVQVFNSSAVKFPEGKAVKVTITVDGKTIGTASYADGINPNESVIIEVNDASYVATAGGHTVKATVASVKGELTAANNSRERTFNAIGENEFEYPATVYETGFSTAPVNGRSLVITKVAWSKVNASRAASGDAISHGDDVRFTVTLYNNGTEATPHMKHGILFETMPSYDPKYWSDNYTQLFTSGIQPGQTVELSTCGGTNNNGGLWKATAGTTNFRVWIDNCADLGIPSSTSANHIESMNVEVANAPRPIEMIESPTGPDRIVPTAIENVSVNDDEATEPADDVWYNMQGIRIAEPTATGLYIHNGKKVLIRK